MPDPGSRRGDDIDHRQYIERYLSDEAAGEPESDEKRAAKAHVAGCAECQEKLAAHAAMKTETEMQTATAIRAPQELRDRILAALDQVDREAESRAQLRSRSFTWIAAGALAACLIAVIILRVYQSSNPVFDGAIATFQQNEEDFSPNIPSASADQLAASFITQFGVPMAWDFSSLGLSEAGGRIDHEPDGTTVGYSMYKGSRGALMCIIYRDDTFHYPPGGELVKGIHLYQYNGYTIAATNRYAVFAIMVSTLPVNDLERVFAQLPG